MKKSLLTLSLLTACLSTYAATISIDDYCGNDGKVTPSEFKNAANAAGKWGAVKFSAKKYLITGSLTIELNGLKVLGVGKNSTTLEWNKTTGAGKMFIVKSNSAKIKNMLLTAPTFPEYKIEPGEDVFEREGRGVLNGLESAIFATGTAKKLTAESLRIEKADVGVGGASGYRHSGLICSKVDFITAKAAVRGIKNGKAPLATDLATKLDVNNCTLTFEPGQGTRAVVMDYGAVSIRDDIDFKESIFKQNRFERLNRWQLGLTRSSNFIIDNNWLYGGGRGGRSGFVHTIHFEEKMRNVVVKNNYLYQWKNNDNDQEMTSRSIIFSGGSHKHGDDIMPVVTYENNRCYGNVNAVFTQGLHKLGDVNSIIRNNKVNATMDKFVNLWKSGSSATLSGNTMKVDGEWKAIPNTSDYVRINE